MIISLFDIIFMYDHRYYPNSTQRLYHISFRVYLRYIKYERSHKVATAFVNERCFTYV